MFLSDVSIKRPVFATMMMVALVVLGVVSYKRLAIDEYPDITYPVVIAQTSYPGASPEVMMRDVSKPIEEALNTVQGIKEITSTSLEGASIVRLQFNLGVDVAVAQQDVQAKVAAIRRQLPEDIQEPVIRHFDPNDSPIMSIALRSNERPIREITDLASEVVQTRIESIEGVGGVNIVGGNARQIRIQVDPVALGAYGLSPAQLTAALQRENQEVPAGRIERGAVERLVRVTGRIVDPAAFADIPVAVRNGTPVRIRDVATVVDGAEDRRTSAEISDSTGTAQAVSLEVLKISGANTVAVADAVRAAIEDLERQLPSDIRMTVVNDDSRRIRESLFDVQLSIVLGAILTVMIIYLFLNSWRSTVITGLTLPVSIISAFFIMWVFDFTVNTMTLLALSLAIGLLIDDAIVVRENIVRHLEMGKSHDVAAKEGTDEIGLAVMATTFAVVAVFIPVAFMGGVIGKIFFQFGVTVAFAVLVSLFVSFTLDPMLSSVWADPEVEHAANDGGEHEAAERRRANPVRRVAFAFNDWFERVGDQYPRWLGWALGHRLIVLAVAASTVVVSFLIIPRLGFTWMPDVDGDEFTVSYRTPPGSRLEYTVDRGRDIASFLMKQPETEFTYMSVGGGFRGTPNNGRIFVALKHGHDRTLSEIQNGLRGQLRMIPGVQPQIQGQRSIFGGFRQPIQVSMQGPESSRLKLVAVRALDAMRQVPGVAEPNSSEEGDIPQLDVRVDRQEAWRAGLGVGAVAATLQPLFSGQRATTWEDPLGFSHDVVVVFPDSLRTSAADVSELPVASSFVSDNGLPSMVPISQVADVRAGVGPQQIERRQLEQQVTLSTGVLPGYVMGDVARDVQKAIDALGLPPGYHAVFGGDVQNLEETKGFVLEALLLAVVFIYLILASLFGSFLQPLAIMLALPLSFIGVALALLVTRGNMNVMTMIGIIMLMGLVTKNGILLVDFTNQLRADGTARADSLLSAGRIRLRPIIMTTTAMIFGMLPLALALGAGAEARAPMARAVIGGLITSTLLTLFVVPVMYTFLDDLGSWVAARLTGGATHETPPSSPAPAPVLATDRGSSLPATAGD
ncbi:MAG TPA: efflux RND transporter permease subunit [Gemmatimonadaceae bacterium]|nr:efflux RND transporter permease subunit [Gemmatimonadaceae bacterium]